MSEESDKFEVHKKAQIAFKKLSPNDGDIIVVKFPDDVHPQQMEKFAEYMEGVIPDGITVFCTRNAVSMECLPKDELNALGWYNFNSGNETVN